MSKESMAALRQKRKKSGLIQMNVWIAKKDKTAFKNAIAPFREKARQVSLGKRVSSPRAVLVNEYLMSFPITPPASVRNLLKGTGWYYDRKEDLWSLLVLPDEQERRADEVTSLKNGYGAKVISR